MTWSTHVSFYHIIMIKFRLDFSRDNSWIKVWCVIFKRCAPTLHLLQAHHISDALPGEIVVLAGTEGVFSVEVRAGGVIEPGLIKK